MAIGSLVIIIMGFIVMYGFGLNENIKNYGFLLGILIIVLGNLLWRLICEYIIILFSIHERLEELNRKK